MNKRWRTWPSVKLGRKAKRSPYKWFGDKRPKRVKRYDEL